MVHATTGRTYRPKHTGGRHRAPSHRLHPLVRHFLRILALVLLAHFLMHFGWYAFSALWVDQLGMPDPATLGKQLGESGYVPVVVLIIGAAAWLQSLLD